jgi:hypothetical protein
MLVSELTNCLLSRYEEGASSPRSIFRLGDVGGEPEEEEDGPAAADERGKLPRTKTRAVPAERAPDQPEELAQVISGRRENLTTMTHMAPRGHDLGRPHSSLLEIFDKVF